VTVVEIIAFIFAVFTLYGCGAEAALYGVVLLVLGIPAYVWQRRRASEQRRPSETKRLTSATQSIQDYLLYARDFDRKFPGFETDIHGLRFETTPTDRRYLVDCIA
jgi:Orn/Lys/Arg decarboxylase, C-terminal domain